MRPFVTAWAGLAAVLALAGAAEAAGPGSPGRRAPTCASPNCAHGHAGHDRPCAVFAQPDRSPLPPISFSRYADNGEFDCTRRVYGDACPRCPRFWYAYRQPYPVPHEQGIVPAGRGGAAGRGVGF